MKPKVSYPIVVIGPIHNGSDEHPALITRVIGDGDTTDGPVAVSAAMFPDGGGEVQWQAHVQLYHDRTEARANLGRFRVAYIAANS